ncbi:MAG: ATP-dependent nuclease [Alphaproteobacteria bacterium]
MKLDKLLINNFRTLEDVEIKFDGYFSAISGKNNAGKTAVIKSIRNLIKGQQEEYYFIEDADDISYSTSLSQWLVEKPDIRFNYSILASKKSDPGIYSFIKKIAELEDLSEEFTIAANISLSDKSEKDIEIFIDGKKLDKYATGEIYQRLRTSGALLLHNSTDGNKKIFYSSGPRSFHEMILSKDEMDELNKEQERIKKKVRKFAQDHRGELSGILGKLEDKYEVELTVFDRLFRSTIPLGINLKDKNLEVPLDDWGAGTQNRTHILMLILSASRIKQQENDENRVTPIVIVEEPESFLHPSAQAEFGRLVRNLARELEIQIIITTHSPYMLCQEKPESNILLDRKLYRGRLRGTQVVAVDENKWMEPFSEILGLNDDSVEPWRAVIGASRDNAILVEGESDKKYLEHISSLNIKGFELPSNIEVISYEGKDALKNSIMLKFVVEKFNKVFITYDLDANKELEKIMLQLGLKNGEDYMAIGKNEEGKDCIEGLLPSQVLKDIHSDNTDLVMKMGSIDSKIRKSAKNRLKSLFLENFKNRTDLGASDLKGFKSLFSNINKAFN